MLGAIIGDIAGSRFEWNNHKSKDFTLFSPQCTITDDSVMTLAIAQAILDAEASHADLGSEAVRCMRFFGRRWARGCYGGSFTRWLESEEPRPYNSFGNGAAMRVSPCGWAATSLDEALTMARKVTEVTHDHPEGIKGAQAVTSAIWLARNGSSREEIRAHIEEFYYPLDFTLRDIRPSYSFDVSCQGSVPQAIVAFLESKNFEDALRNAISLGGDSDTLAAIAGSIAEAYYGVPQFMRRKVVNWLDSALWSVVESFEGRFPPRIA